jgi:hypothetical protein
MIVFNFALPNKKWAKDLIASKLFNLDEQTVIKATLSILPLSLLFCVDTFFHSEYSFVQVLFLVNLVLFTLTFIYYLKSFVIAISSLNFIVSQILILLGTSLLVLAVQIVIAGYVVWEDAFFNTLLIFSWLGLADYIAQKFTKNNIHGRLWILFVAFGFVYLIWTELFLGVAVGVISIYSSFLDFTGLLMAVVFWLESFQKLVLYVNDKIDNLNFSMLIASLALLLLSLIAYESYLTFVYQTTIVRYQIFWYKELPVLFGSVFLINLYYKYYRPLTEKSVNEEKTENHQLIVRQTKKDLPLAFDDIAYIEIQNSISIAYTYSNGKVVLEKGLNQLEEELNPAQFFRVNRQLILSLSCVEDYKRDVNQKLVAFYKTLNGDLSSVVISRYRSPHFKQWYRKSELIEVDTI